MKGQRGLARMAFTVGLGMGMVAVTPPLPAGADQARLAIFDGYSGSHSVYMQGRATAIFALPADFFVGPTFAELNSQPRAQGYAATFGFPLARNATGVGVPAPEYRGQCWANYPGAPAEDHCGLPAREFPQAPDAPNGSPVTGRMSSATVDASGDQANPEATRAEGSAAWGELSVGDALHIGTNLSRSTSFIKDGVLHAVTASRAQDITVAGVLHIGMVEAMAEATHDGAPGGGKGTAHTDMQNITIAGTPVAIGPGGLAVRGQPVGSAPAAVAGPVLAAMAAHQMTIEPLEQPRVVQDPASGLVEATTSGFRVVMFSPNGDKLEMIFGQAVARAAATRVQDDTPVGIDIPTGGATTASQPNEAPAPAAPAASLVRQAAPVTKSVAAVPAAASGVSSRLSARYLAFCE
jgi:hypothetical protein